MSASPGTSAANRTGLWGMGECAAPTRTTGARSTWNSNSAIDAEISAPMPRKRGASPTTTTPAGAPDGRLDQIEVERHDRAQIDDFEVEALLGEPGCKLQADRQHPPVCDDSDVTAGPGDPCLADRDEVVRAADLPAAAAKPLVHEEDRPDPRHAAPT